MAFQPPGAYLGHPVPARARFRLEADGADPHLFGGGSQPLPPLRLRTHEFRTALCGVEKIHDVSSWWAGARDWRGGNSKAASATSASAASAAALKVAVGIRGPGFTQNAAGLLFHRHPHAGGTNPQRLLRWHHPHYESSTAIERLLIDSNDFILVIAIFLVQAYPQPLSQTRLRKTKARRLAGMAAISATAALGPTAAA